MPIVDTHAHLDMPQFTDDLEEVLRRAEQAGVARVLCVGTDLASSRRCVEMARRFPGRLFAAAGIHPNDLQEAGPQDFSELERLCALPQTVAVGETGLDFHYDAAPRDAQLSAFRRHALIALAADKPLIVHARKSDEAVLAALEEFAGRLRGVRHCFDASPEAATRYVECGFFISFGGAVSRPGHKKLKEAARAVPADRLLVETDSPYQSPAVHAGRRNEPAFLVETVRALAALRGQEPEEVAAATTANALALFFPPGQDHGCSKGGTGA